jgi:hypothetical protein
LLMLRDGAMVHGYVADSASVSESLISAGRAILGTLARQSGPAAPAAGVTLDS